MADRILKRKRKMRRRPSWDSAPFDLDQDLEEVDVRFKNDPWHTENPSNVFAARRLRLAREVVKKKN